MFEYFIFFLIMTLIGVIGSAIGGILGGVIKINKKENVSAIMDITAGIMTGIVCFDMIPESIKLSKIYITLIGFFVGTIIIFIIDFVSSKKNNNNLKTNSSTKSFVIMLSMAIHNMIEGVAVGCSFSYSYFLAINVIISMILHDIPEGMVVGITNKIDKFNFKNIIFNSSLVGAFFGLGAFLGKLIGDISNYYIGICLSLAAGAMLYIVSCDLIPSSKENCRNRFIYIFYIVGIILSLLILCN